MSRVGTRAAALAAVIFTSAAAAQPRQAPEAIAFWRQLGEVDRLLAHCDRAAARARLAAMPKAYTRDEIVAVELRQIDLLLDDRARWGEALARLLVAEQKSAPEAADAVSNTAQLLRFLLGRYDDILVNYVRIPPVKAALLLEQGQTKQALALIERQLSPRTREPQTDPAIDETLAALQQAAGRAKARSGAFIALVKERIDVLSHIRIGTAPQVLQRVAPEYPRRALADGISGWVEVQVQVNELGTPSGAKVVRASPPDVFDRAAVDGVSRWTFDPGYRACQPAPSVGLQRIDFILPEP